MTGNASKSKYIYKSGGSGAIWLMGAIGTLVYFLHFHSGSFALIIYAFIKALFWPGFLVYYMLQSMSI